MATDIMATSTTKLTLFHSIRLARLVWFARASLKMRLASLRSAQNSAAAGLCSWVLNIVAYYDIVITVEVSEL